MFKKIAGLLKGTDQEQIQIEIYNLLGVMEGINLDREISPPEVEALRKWLDSHSESTNKPPFSDIDPVIRKALEDGVIDGREKEQIVNTAMRACNREHFNQTGSSLATLRGMLEGITSDQEISQEEAVGLARWVENNKHMQGVWEYDMLSITLDKIQSGETMGKVSQRRLIESFNRFIDAIDQGIKK